MLSSSKIYCMKYSTILFVFSVMLTLVACGDSEKNNDDKVQTKDISRDGAIETVVTTEHLNDSTDLLVTTHKIWKNNLMIKETRHADTLPSLGTMQSEYTHSPSGSCIRRIDIDRIIHILRKLCILLGKTHR